MTFVRNGEVKGIIYQNFWSWHQTGDEIFIAYDNGLGLSVTQAGVLSRPATMSGSARASRGEAWTWRASRLLRSDPLEASDIP